MKGPKPGTSSLVHLRENLAAELELPAEALDPAERDGRGEGLVSCAGTGR